MDGWYVMADDGKTEVAGPFDDQEQAEEAAEQMWEDGGIDYDVAYVNAPEEAQ